MQYVNINVAKGGKIKIDAVGFTGNACKAATAAFEKALGVVQTDVDKPELFAEVAPEVQSEVSN